MARKKNIINNQKSSTEIKPPTINDAPKISIAEEIISSPVEAIIEKPENLENSSIPRPDETEDLTALPDPSPIPSRARKVLILTVLCDIFVLTAYVWLISIGTWTKWQSISNNYDYNLLATSFRAGRLSLEIKPDPALLALSNPYDPEGRTGVPFPWDASLYKGKFYLYFGPTPAIILLVAKTIYPGPIGDQYIFFAFISGTYLVGSLFIFKIWRRFFTDISLWKIGCSLLVIGLIDPFFWTLGIPFIYNTAIMSGQFFFLAGFYLAFDALDRDTISTWKLVLTGILWTAAIGSRFTQILPIGFMAVMISIWLLRKYRQTEMTTRSIQALPGFVLTLTLGVIALGWYNWARFSSVFETGITYQLAGIDFQKYHSLLFAPSYIIENLYNYFLNPPKLIYSFPWFRTLNGINQSIITGLPLPDIYRSQKIVGLLYNAPFIIFAIIPVARIFPGGTDKTRNEEDQRSFNWLVIALLGSFLSTTAFLLFFFFSAGRYLNDFLPCLLLLSVIGFWQLSHPAASKPVFRVLYIFSAITLILISIIVSNLLALDVNNTGFKALNPLLWRQLSNFFRP
jgi:hypothetical protein